MLIVSHLNACNSEGLSWVDEVLITGLRNGDGISDWRIEVHHSDSDNGENEISHDGEDSEKDDGPAVYIIQKVSVPCLACNNIEIIGEIGKGRTTSKASIKFFGY